MGDSDGKLQNQNNSYNDEQYLASLPIGVRFKPTDLELVDYLLKKATESPLPPNRIRNIDVYSYDPDVLIGSLPHIRGTDWYFFSPRNKKYPNGKRPDRATPGGFWKPTAADTNVTDREGRVVGKKRVLEFYKGPPKGKGKGGDGRTNWKMHEYVLPTDAAAAPNNNGNSMLLDKVVLCKIYYYNPHAAEGSDLQERDTSGSTSEHPKNRPPPCLTDFRSACARGSHFRQPISFGGPTSNIAGSFINGETKTVLGFYNGQPKERNWSTNWNNMPQLDNLGRDARSNLQGDGSNNINTYTQSSVFSQGGHFGQPISFAPATDNISGFRSEQYQEPFPLTQHNPGPSNENHQQASFVSGLGVTGFAPTTNNIAGSPRGICQESFTSTQCNVGPLNPYQLAHLQLERGATRFGSTHQSLLETQHYGPVNNNLDQDQTPSLVICQDIGNNVNQLPFNLDQHSTPLKHGSAYPQGSYDGQSISFGASECFSSGPSQQSFHLTQYSPGAPSMDLAGDNWFGIAQKISTSANEPCQDHSLPATQHHVPENSNLYQYRTPSSVTRYHNGSNANHSQPAVHHNFQSAYHQGGHPTSFAAAAGIDNISGYLNELYIDQSLPPTQHYGPETFNLDQEQTNHSQPAVHHNLQSAYHQGGHPTSFAAAAGIDNISGYLNEPYIDQSLPPTQHYGPETFNLDQEQTNHSQPAVHHNLQSAYHQGGRPTSFAAAAGIDNISGYLNELYTDQPLPPTQHYGPETYNLDQEQTPSSVTGRHCDTNVDQLPSDLHHHATPSEAMAVEHQLGAPTPEDDYFNALARDLQDPNLTWMVDAFVNQNGKS